MSDKVEYSRLLLKRTNTAGITPTIPPVSATTLNQFTPTDLFVGEMFVNVEDDRAWVRTNNSIIEFNFTGGTSGSTVIPSLTQVLNSGNTTGGFDILFPSGSKPVYTGLASGTTSTILGLDASGNTIATTVTGGGGVSGDYLPLSGGTVTGNTYFGITSGITIDQANNRIGIGTATPQHTIEAFGTKSRVSYENTAGGVFQISGDTFLPRFQVNGAPSITNPLFTLNLGVRTWDDITYPGYGKVGDGHLYASNEMNGLNIINRQGTGMTEDYIQFYAGQDANGTTADMHIQGSGATRGFIGLGTETPTEKLDVDGNVKMTGDLTIGTVGTTTPLYVLGIDSNGLVVSGGTGASGTSGTSFSGGSGNCITDLYVTNIHGCSPINVADDIIFSGDVFIKNITSGGSSTYLTIDSDTGQLYTATGAAGSSGTSGTSGGGGGGGLPGVHYNYPLNGNFQELLTLTGGYQAVAWGLWAMRVIAYPVIPAQNVSFSGISLDLYNAAAGGEFAFALYDDNNNKPGNLIFTSTTISSASGYAVKQYNVDYTLSAGTRYWLGMGQNGTSSGSTIISTGYQMAGLFTIGTIATNDGYGVNFKYALSNVMPSWPYFPSTFDLASTFAFNSSWVVNGFFGGTNVAPAFRFVLAK